MCRLQVRVIANSHRPGLTNFVGKVLHLKVGSPPADGRANRELCELLAESLRIAPSFVRVRYGHMARQKTVEIEGLNDADVLARLRSALPVASPYSRY